MTPIGFAIGGHAVWLVVTNVWVNTYTSAATYDAAFLLAGFIVGQRAAREKASLLFNVAAAFAAGIAAWSLWQRFTGEATRGHALFETPATLATVLNLVLVPGLVLLMTSERRIWLLVGAMTLVSAALIGAASRGGWIAFAIALAIAIAMCRRGGVRLGRGGLLTAASVLIAGGLVALVSAPLTWSEAVGTAQVSGMSRFALYRTAAAALSADSLLTGTGYLSFRYVLEGARASTFGYENAMTYFVHNDYLQRLLELGVPGLILLVLVAVLPIAQLWLALPRVDERSRIVAIALASAMASMAVHASVDFPFHIALCLVMYGAAAGIAQALLGERSAGAEALTSDLSRPARIARAAVAAAAIWILVTPVAAEAVAARARALWSAGEGQRAAYWFEVARRIEAKDWRYHWYAGQFWYVQAQAGGKPAAANLADASFRAGLAANPLEAANLVWLISTHVHLRSLLGEPADKATLEQWGRRAFAIAPLDTGVQAQRALIAKFEAKASVR